MSPDKQITKFELSTEKMCVVKTFSQAQQPAYRRHSNPMSFESILNHEPQSLNTDLSPCQRFCASDRYSSPESLTSVETISERSTKREPRQKYTAEQLYFLWYHRIDLREHWHTIVDKFEIQFNQRRNVGALECRFYRILKDWGIEKVREQSRIIGRGDRSELPRYGVIQQTTARFWWMHEPHRVAHPLPEFRHRQAPSMATICCQQHPCCRC